MSDDFEAIAFIGIGILASLLASMVGYVCWKVCGKCVERQHNHQACPSQPLLKTALACQWDKLATVPAIADKKLNAERDFANTELLTNISGRSESMLSPMSRAAPSATGSGSADLLLCVEQSFEHPDASASIASSGKR
jgi:hypothetical protein